MVPKLCGVFLMLFGSLQGHVLDPSSPGMTVLEKTWMPWDGFDLVEEISG